MGGTYAERKKHSRSADDEGKLSTARISQDSFPELSFAGRTVQNADPVPALTMRFTNTFDAIGRENAKKLSQQSGVQRAQQPEQDNSSAAQENKASLESLRKTHDSPEYAHSEQELESGAFTDRFSAYAFSGGKLAAAVMAGQGKQMLTFCLAKSLGRPAPQGELQRRLLSQSAVSANIPANDAAVRFNRDALSAVGVVADTLKSSSRLFDVLRKIALDDGNKSANPLEMNEINTLKSVLPFMDIRKDERLLSQYKERLKALEGDTSQEGIKTAQLLRAAAVKQTAVLQQKRQEQRNFLTVLDRISNNVKEAEKLFANDIPAEDIVEQVEQLVNSFPSDDDNNKNNSAEEIAQAVADFFTEIRGEDSVGTDREIGSERGIAGEETMLSDS